MQASGALAIGVKALRHVLLRSLTLPAHQFIHSLSLKDLIEEYARAWAEQWKRGPFWSRDAPPTCRHRR